MASKVIEQSLAVRFEVLASKFEQLILDEQKIGFGPSQQKEWQLADEGGEAVSCAWSHGLLLDIKKRYDTIDEVILYDLRTDEYGEYATPTSSAIFYLVFGYCSPFFHFGRTDDEGRFHVPYYELDVGCAVDWKTYSLGKTICSFDYRDTLENRNSLIDAILDEEEVSEEKRFVRAAYRDVLDRYVKCSLLLKRLVTETALETLTITKPESQTTVINPKPDEEKPTSSKVPKTELKLLEQWKRYSPGEKRTLTLYAKDHKANKPSNIDKEFLASLNKHQRWTGEIWLGPKEEIRKKYNSQSHPKAWATGDASDTIQTAKGLGILIKSGQSWTLPDCIKNAVSGCEGSADNSTDVFMRLNAS